MPAGRPDRTVATDRPAERAAAGGTSPVAVLRRWGIPLLLVAAGIAAYGNSLDGAFLLDDQPWIQENPQLHKLWPLTDLLARTSRPVVQVSLALNYAWGGLESRGYHIVNLIVHLLAGLALYGLVRRMLDSEPLRVRYGKPSSWLAMAVAGIWLVHPLQTESVTYAIQRAESLMGLLYLLTIYCGARACSSTRAGPWSAAAVAACALGMGTKEVMVSAPIVMLVYDRMFASASLRDAMRARWALYAGLAGTWLIVASSLALSAPGEQMYVVAPLEPWRYLVTQSEVIVHYLRLALWPAPLVFDYAWPGSESLLAVLPSAAIVLALLGGTIYALGKRYALAGFWGAWFFLVLAPTSSVMPIADIAVEHRMYLPLAAVVVAAVIGVHVALASVLRGPGPAATVRIGLEAVLLGVTVTLLCVATVRRNDDYRSAVAMWTDTVAKRPDNPRAHNNLGVALVKQGRTAEAVAEYAAAVRLKPDYVDAQSNLGGALARSGRYQEAIAPLSAAARMRPASADAHGNLGTALLRAGRTDEAIAELSKAVSLKPDSPQARNDFGNALYARGRFQDAAAEYGQAVRLQPGFAEAHQNLGLALLETGDERAAMAAFAEAIRLKPDYAKARNNLGILLFRAGRFDEAVTQFAEVVRIDPAFADARNNLQAARARR